MTQALVEITLDARPHLGDDLAEYLLVQAFRQGIRSSSAGTGTIGATSSCGCGCGSSPGFGSRGGAATPLPV